MENQLPVRGQLPTVINWGKPKFAVQQAQDRRVYYPDGMQLEIHLPDVDLVLRESIRVIEGRAEHKFSGKNVEGSGAWNRTRITAFQQCLHIICASSNRPFPKRMIIFGPSHQTIQEGIKSRFASEIAGIGRKRVHWGDETEVAADGSGSMNTYGGWGLNTYHIIPNRFELWEMMAEDQDDLFSDDDELLENFEHEEDYFVNEAKLLNLSDESEPCLLHKEEPLFEHVNPRAAKKVAKRPVMDEELTLYPSSDDDDDGYELANEDVDFPETKRVRLSGEGKTEGNQSLLEPDNLSSSIISPNPLPLKEELTLGTCSGEEQLDDIDEWLIHRDEDVSV